MVEKAGLYVTRKTAPLQGAVAQINLAVPVVSPASVNQVGSLVTPHPLEDRYG
jgi:hypothetical protein